MKEYELEIIEKMTSRIMVEAETEDEAYEKAMEELRDGFEAPYHIEIYVDDYKVINEKELGQDE